MIILEDERQIEEVGICENCNIEAKGRRVPSYGWMMEIRRYWFICFGCMRPRIKWQATERSKYYWSPITHSSVR